MMNEQSKSKSKYNDFPIATCTSLKCIHQEKKGVGWFEPM